MVIESYNHCKLTPQFSKSSATVFRRRATTPRPSNQGSRNVIPEPSATLVETTSSASEIFCCKLRSGCSPASNTVRLETSAATCVRTLLHGVCRLQCQTHVTIVIPPPPQQQFTNIFPAYPANRTKQPTRLIRKLQDFKNPSTRIFLGQIFSSRHSNGVGRAMKTVTHHTNLSKHRRICSRQRCIVKTLILGLQIPTNLSLVHSLHCRNQTPIVFGAIIFGKIAHLQ